MLRALKAGETIDSKIQVAKDAIKLLLQQKLVHYARHDFGIVLFGTRETAN